MINYYSWILDSTSLPITELLNTTINWEDSSFLLDSDLFFLFNTFYNSFILNYFSTFFISFFGFLDIVLTDYTLFNSFLFDLWFEFNTKFDYTNFLFFSNTNDYSFFYLLQESDYYSFFNNLQFYLLDCSFSDDIVLFYDAFPLQLYFSYLQYLVYLKWFFIFFMGLFLFIPFIRLKAFDSIYDYFYIKFILFLVVLAIENRAQFDLLIIFLTFIFIVWIIVLMTFDDLNSECLELFHLFLILIFIFIIFYLLFRYSIHYFAFLENSVSDGRSTAYITKQMVRDLSNTFALFLRFFLLLFRLNIYDGLDDFLDSYYIFAADFEEDSYFDEDTFHTNAFYYFKDNQEDNVFFHPNEQDWYDDLFSRYYVIWGKFFLFNFFILEELFRVSLAFYIFYLIIFEVHAVNLSYFEDKFFHAKRGFKWD